MQLELRQLISAFGMDSQRFFIGQLAEDDRSIRAAVKSLRVARQKESGMDVLWAFVVFTRWEMRRHAQSCLRTLRGGVL